MTIRSRNVMLIALLVVLAAWISYRATISHGLVSGPWPAISAALITLLATLPPLYFTRLLSNGAANQLAVVSWRLAIILPAVALATKYVDDERKCYLITLLACYFISLPLESWLLIRDVQRNQHRDPRASDS